MDDTVKKTCSLCKKSLEVCSFSINRKSSDGLHAWCKPCCRKMEKLRYDVIKQDRIREVREWQIKNADKVKQYKKNWRTKENLDTPTEG